MKKSIITLVAVASLVALSAMAFAAPRGGRGAGQGQNQPTAEQRATIQKIVDAHQDKIYELREKIWAKHTELQALSNSGKAEKSDIQSLVADISKLRDAMNKERLAMRADIEKQTGLKGYGYHRGGMGGACGDDCGPGYGGKGFGRGMNSCAGGMCN
jgi:zinc resistance-associated protein